MKMEDHPKLKLFLRKDPLCKQNPHVTNQGEGDKAQTVIIRNKMGDLGVSTDKLISKNKNIIF